MPFIASHPSLQDFRMMGFSFFSNDGAALIGGTAKT